MLACVGGEGYLALGCVWQESFKRSCIHHVIIKQCVSKREEGGGGEFHPLRRLWECPK